MELKGMTPRWRVSHSSNYASRAPYNGIFNLSSFAVSSPPIKCFSQFWFSLSEVDAYVFYQSLPWFRGKLLKLGANFEAGAPFWGSTRCEFNFQQNCVRPSLTYVFLSGLADEFVELLESQSFSLKAANTQY